MLPHSFCLSKWDIVVSKPHHFMREVKVSLFYWKGVMFLPSEGGSEYNTFRSSPGFVD